MEILLSSKRAFTNFWHLLMLSYKMHCIGCVMVCHGVALLYHLFVIILFGDRFA